MQVSLTDYAVFERNGTWCHIVKKINAKTYAIEYEIQSGFISKEKAFESYQISLENYKTAISRIKKITQSNYTFTEYLEYWHKNYIAEYTNSSSQLQYFWVIYKIIMPKIQKDVLLSMLTDVFVNDLISECKSYCPSAGEMTYKVLRVILQEAEKNDYISEKVLAGIKPCYCKRKKFVLYNKEQATIFLKVSKIYHGCYPKIMLALFCGLRTGEILALKYSDFHKVSKTLVIERQYTRDYIYEDETDNKEATLKVFSSEKSFKPPKTSNSNRCLKIPDVIFKELNVRKKENRKIIEKTGKTEFADYICLGTRGTIKSDSTLNVGLKAITNSCNLPKISMHGLRHMFATALIELNVPLETISAALGHKNVNTAFEIYCGIMDAAEQIKNTVSNTMDPAIALKNSALKGDQ